jgi:hypothetical protein
LTNTVRISENQSCIASMSSEPSSRSAWNSRSRPKSEASSAPIHRIAGPIRAKQVEIRADAEGNHGHHGEKEQHAKHRRPARAGGDRQVTPEQRHHAQISPEAAL